VVKGHLGLRGHPDGGTGGQPAQEESQEAQGQAGPTGLPRHSDAPTCP